MRSIDATKIPRCEKCGSQRIFELQLMPALMQSLLVKGSSHNLDVGTVIIYTCSGSCWSGTTCVEHIMVQHDPDEHLFRKIS